MRNLLLLLTLLSAASLTAQNLNLTLSQGTGHLYSTSEYDKTNKQYGKMHSTALDLEYSFNKHFALHSGLAYEQRKVNFSNPDWWGGYYSSYTSQYFGEQITAPLTLVCTPWTKRPLRPFVRFGLFQSFILNETVENYGINIINNTFSDGIERDGGLLGGLGCVFNEGPWALKLELRASAGVRPLPGNDVFFLQEGRLIPEVVKETFPVRTVLLQGGIQHTF